MNSKLIILGVLVGFFLWYLERKQATAKSTIITSGFTPVATTPTLNIPVGEMPPVYYPEIM